MRCPEGHESAATDYCDTCGAPMSGTATATPTPGAEGLGAAGPAARTTADPVAAEPPATPAGPATQECPNCSAVNAADNLFCEVCGFDFTTGVMPRVEGGEPSFLDLPTPAAAESARPVEEPASSGSSLDVPGEMPGAATEAATGAGSADASNDTGNGTDTDADAEAPLVSPGSDSPEASPVVEMEPDTPRTFPEAAEPDEVASPEHDHDHDHEQKVARNASVPPAASAVPTPTPSPRPAPTAPAESGDSREVAAAEPATPPSGGAKPVNRPPSREVAGDWVVEVWIDPDWYAAQDTGEACPSPAPPEVVRLAGSDALVGRRSRTSVPDVDCGIDSAVSRRQALLTSDGRRWWVEDLDSSNGTWVAPAIGPLPAEPISSRTEIDADDRIYVGAWTRLVVRPAVDSEIASA